MHIFVVSVPTVTYCVNTMFQFSSLGTPKAITRPSNCISVDDILHIYCVPKPQTNLFMYAWSFVYFLSPHSHDNMTIVCVSLLRTQNYQMSLRKSYLDTCLLHTRLIPKAEPVTDKFFEKYLLHVHNSIIWQFGPKSLQLLYFNVFLRSTGYLFLFS